MGCILVFIYVDDVSGLNGDNAICALTRAFACCCLEHIDLNADALILSEAFLQSDQKLLCEILDRDELMISEEITIWNAALRWADEKCRQNGKEPSAANRRAMLGPALFKIRFPLISQEDFENIVPSGVLTDAELVSILQHYSRPDRALPKPYQLKFPTNGRAGTNSEVVWCWNGTVDDDKQAFIQLKCKLLFVALRWGRKFAAVPKQRLSTLSKLWEMKLPFDEFGQTACKALNGTISRKLCDGNWCNAEQGQTEPGHTEPGHTEPGHTEPGHTEPGHTEPGHTEPTEPGHTESGHTEPGHTEPTEPGHTESGHTEPESGHTEPGQHRVRNGVFVAVPSPTLSTIVVFLLLMFG
uniref:BACK domain-containing protein n=1 Tax=Globodera rostochiensis TaxID=31243 RepID=A0A914H183_GLORO